MKKIKWIYLTIILCLTCLYLNNINYIVADTSNQIEITNVTINKEEFTIRFEALIDETNNIIEHGFIFKKGIEQDITKDTIDVYIETVNSFYENNTYAVSFIMPTYGMKDTFSTRAYCILSNNEIIYSDSITTSYENELNTNLVSIDEYELINNQIRFSVKTYVNDAVEYGIIFKKGHSDHLTYPKELDPEQYLIGKVTNLNSNNQYFISINNFPTYALKQDITLRAYVKYLDKNNNEQYYYSNHIYDLTYEQLLIEQGKNIISNPRVELYETGLKFTTEVNVNDAVEYGVIVGKGKIKNLMLNHEYVNSHKDTCMTIYINFLNKDNTYVVNLANIPARAYSQELTIKSYIKYLDKNGNEQYYYSDSIYTSYEQILGKALVENIVIKYNQEKDGLRFSFKTNAILTNQEDTLEFGIIIIKGDTNLITINSENAYIQKFANELTNEYAVTIINFPDSVYDETFCAVGYIKYLNETGTYNYCYSKEIAKITYNQALNEVYE